MMILAGITAGKMVIGILSVSLAVLIIVIAYKKLLGYLGKGALPKEDYCVLYSLEENPSIGEIDFYFTAEKTKEVSIHILDQNYNLVREIWRKESTVGGNIIKFDTKSLANGNYFYALISDNQKTMKKMAIANH